MVSPISRRALLGAAAFACMLIGSWPALAQSAGAAAAGGASGGTEAGVPPGFTVDPAWPKALPNNWIIGAVAGVAVDKRDHIWIVHRPATIAARQLLAEKNPPETTCCVRAPPVLVFDRDGNLLRHWGGPGQGYEWPAVEHGIYVDANDNVWLAGNGDEGPPHPEVHARRPLPPADRACRAVHGQCRHGQSQPPRRRRGRYRGPRAVRCGRLRQPPGHRVRQRDRRLQAALGRLWRQPGRRQRRRL